jgi:hypothetical protein
MNPAFRFARGGKVYKELEADQAHEIAGYIRTGIIGANDDYWMPGMGDWKKVYSRQWNFPAPSSSELPPAAPNSSKPTAPTPTAAPASGGATIQSFLQATTAYSYECATCEKGFNDPAKAPSGYSVIGKAVKFFLFSLLAQFVLGVVSYGFYTFNVNRDPLTPPNKFMAIIVALVVLVLGLVAIGLLLMSLFELIASSVTHGLYRFNPLRCPHCTSSTYTRKGA